MTCLAAESNRSRNCRQTYKLRRLHAPAGQHRCTHPRILSISRRDISVAIRSGSYRRRASAAGTTTIPEPVRKRRVRVIAVGSNPVRCARGQRSAAGERYRNPRARAMGAWIRVGGMAEPARGFRRRRGRENQSAIDLRSLGYRAGWLIEAAGAYSVTVCITSPLPHRSR